VRVTCDQCGEDFEARSIRARLCSNKCRQRASRGQRNAESAPNIVQLTPVSPLDGSEFALVDATRRELDAAGVLDTVAGHLALELAAQVCASRDTGSAKAAASKEFRAVMADALKDVAKQADSLDELASRRLKRASGG
jgi:hypothetical protein